MQITGSDIFALVRREIADNRFGLGPELDVLQTALEGLEEAALRPPAHRVQVGESSCFGNKIKEGSYQFESRFEFQTVLAN